MRKSEKDMTGDDSVTETVEMAGWGVKEAEANNKKDASEYISPMLFSFNTKPRC
jgi:hypothetical protein